MASHTQDTFNSFDFDFTMPQQQSFDALKTGQGNTASAYFDEGIDTTTSGSIFGQQSFDTILDPTIMAEFGMDQHITLDNTSSAAWASSFPPTPVQSFDSIYPQFNTSTLGKRSLQLDVQDFPLAKRHESVGYSPFTGSASVTGSSWHETQPTPSSSVEMGLSDEAADVCATWFSKYNVLPGDRHIDSLSQLTGESSTAIRNWFGQALKQGMSHDSAYKSQTGFTHQDPILFTGSSGPSDTVAQSLFPEVPYLNDAQTTTAATTTQGPLRGGRKGCNPTDDPELLKRDPNKIYQCTRKCGKRYGRKCDWKRNEEEGYPSKSWICALCVSQGDARVKPCFRKYHFSQHFRNIHPGLNSADYEQASIVESDTDFPKKCGFCTHRFTDRQDRIDHIAEHFKQGKCMLDWTDDDDDSSHDSDNTDDNDDDNDRPDSDGFGNGKPSFPPSQDPRDDGSGSHSKHDGNGGNGGQHPPHGGYFQFQLNQLAESAGSCAYQHVTGANQHINNGIGSCSISCSSDQQDLHGSADLHGKAETTAGSHQHALAGDAVPRTLNRLHSDDVCLQRVEKDSLADNADTAKSTQIGQIPMTIVPDPPIEVDLPSESPLAIAALNVLESHVTREKFTPVLSCTPKDPLRRSVSPLNSQSFKSLKLLGQGGFSTVDEVVHRETSLRVSRKTLKNRDRSALEELKKEVDVLQKLRHPHVVRLLGSYTRGDKMSILLSPVADTTLAAWLDAPTQHGQTGLAQTIVKMLGCLSSTVRYLHEQRPVVKHMDIKPQNILVMQGNQEFPHVVLSDFGISSIEENGSARSAPLTRQYCAPEVSEGVSREQAADIWSLGCVFVEMATVAFSEGNSDWLDLRCEFRGRGGKYYWQDVPALHSWLSQFLDASKDATETTVVRTVKSMLDPEPSLRPDAAKLTMVFTPAPCCLSWPNEKTAYPGPVEESASVDRFVREDTVDCHAHVHLHGDADQKPCDSVAHAKSWLDVCAHHHDACRQHVSRSKALPTRLVDIRPDGITSSSIRVVNSATLDAASSPVDYISLGYLWDENEPVLSTDRLQAMQSELPRDLLPKALNEAISAADRIGYRYIWVDSLCVLQDSEDDKERECRATADVYRNSALTIVLDQLKNSVSDQANIHDSSRITSGIPGASTADANHDGSSAPMPAINFQAPGFGWDTRAWALQERFLSPRHLHLGEQQMYWECNALKASETFPQGLPPLLWEKVHTKSASAVVAQPPSHVNYDHKVLAEFSSGTALEVGDETSSRQSRQVNHNDKAHGEFYSSGTVLEVNDKTSARSARQVNANLRNQQWIRKEGDAVGDPMEAQMQLQLCDGMEGTSPDAIDNVKSKIQDNDFDNLLQSLIEGGYEHVRSHAPVPPAVDEAKDIATCGRCQRPVTGSDNVSGMPDDRTRVPRRATDAVLDEIAAFDNALAAHPFDGNTSNQATIAGKDGIDTNELQFGTGHDASFEGLTL